MVCVVGGLAAGWERVAVEVVVERATVAAVEAVRAAAGNLEVRVASVAEAARVVALVAARGVAASATVVVARDAGGWARVEAAVTARFRRVHDHGVFRSR